MRQTNKGFTIIEMLVVISIVSLLSSVVLSVVSDTRKKANKIQRASIIQEYKKALTLGYDKYGGYPNPSGSAGGYCLGNFSGGTCYSGTYSIDATVNGVVGEFLPSLPTLKPFNIGTFVIHGPVYHCIQLNGSTDARGACAKVIIGWNSPDMGINPTACLPGIVAGYSGGYPNCNLTIE